MKKTLQKLTVILILLISFNFSYSQDQSRYLVIDDLNAFFVEKNDEIICDFQLFNIKDEESSKPSYVSITELKNVIDFSIESKSSTNENQRKCRLVMKTIDYEETFRLVLYKLEVKYIIYKGEINSADNFYLIINQN
jgi:hypothetical protein